MKNSWRYSAFVFQKWARWSFNMYMVQACNKFSSATADVIKLAKKLNSFNEDSFDIDVKEHNGGFLWTLSHMDNRYFSLLVTSEKTKLVWHIDIRRMMNNANGYY